MNAAHKKVIQKLCLLLVTTIFFVLAMYPFLIVLFSASKSSFEILSGPAKLPQNWGQLLQNIARIWGSSTIKYPSSVVASIIITVLSLLCICLFSSMAAWVLLRSKSRTAHILFMVFVSGMVVPFQSVMFPLVELYRRIGAVLGLPMLRSYHGIIFAYVGFGAPLAVFMFHGFMKSIPLELEEAATIDGCSKPSIFFLIVTPILKPIFITIVVLDILWIWNDYLLPALILGVGQKLQTIPLAIQAFAGSFLKKWDLIMTAVFMAAIPVIIFFLMVQKHVIRGMTSGAIK